MAKFKEKFKDLDEFTISALINQLSELREDKYKEKKSEPLRVVCKYLSETRNDPSFSYGIHGLHQEMQI